MFVPKLEFPRLSEDQVPNVLADIDPIKEF